MTELETRLRATLAEHARRAPDAGPVADRILAEVPAPARVLRPRRGWRTWTLPLLAAGAVAAVVAAVVGLGPARHTAAPPPAVSHSVSPAAPTAPLPSPSATRFAPPPAASATPKATSPRGTGVVTGFQALDVTFVSADHGWALGSADCVSGPGRCTALFRTTDGRSWASMPGAAFNVPGVRNCQSPCVEHLRFADDQVGYAYGPDALLMTTDGGRDWTRVPNFGADALETLNGNVILVRAVDVSCPQRCLLLERAPVGSTQWTPFTLSGLPGGVLSIALTRSGHDAILAGIGYNPAKGLNAPSAVFRSSDDGAHWTKIAAVCPQVGAGYYPTVTAVAVAPDGSVAAACAVRSLQNLDGYGSTVSSVDGGATFTAPPHGGKLPPALMIATPSRDVQLVVANGAAYRSADAGDSWTPIPQLRDVTFLGFESPTVGRAVAANGRVIWTTHDAGRTWTGVRFP